MVSASMNSPSVMMILPELVVLAIAVAIEVHGVLGLQSEEVPFFFRNESSLAGARRLGGDGAQHCR